MQRHEGEEEHWLECEVRRRGVKVQQERQSQPVQNWGPQANQAGLRPVLRGPAKGLL